MTTEYTKNFGLALPDFRMGPWHDLVNGDFTQIDSLLYGILSGSEVVAWANNTHYIVGTSVLDGVDASIWMNTIDHTSPTTGTFAQARTAHPTYWVRLLTGFAPRGEWKNNTQYFPYDLAYQSSMGIFALCEQSHMSNPSGTIKDDQAFWAFLCDMSQAALTTAKVVTYTNAISPSLTATNVQDAIDQLAAEVVALNSVNITQGNQITQLNADLATLRSDMNSADAAASALAMKLVGNQVTTGGFRFTSFNMGNGSGNVVPDPMKGNYQYINNVGAFAFFPPTNDCAIDILMTNGSGAVVPAFSGYSVGSNTGDTITATVGSRFIISIRQINNVSAYVVKALQ